MREQFISWCNSFYRLILSIKDIVVDIWNTVFSILKTIWYWLTTLVSGLSNVFNEVLWNGALTTLYDTLNWIASYIWGPAMVIICSLFLIIVGRIIIAFVFKIFRLNIDYHALNSKNRRWNQEDSKINSNLFK